MALSRPMFSSEFCCKRRGFEANALRAAFVSEECGLANGAAKNMLRSKSCVGGMFSSRQVLARLEMPEKSLRGIVILTGRFWVRNLFQFESIPI